MKPYFLFLALPFVAHAACELSQNEAGEYEISSYADLQLVGVEDCGLDADYRLVKDIDASESQTNYFTPIGDFCEAFTGSFHGAGHRIKNLRMYNKNYQGLFCGSMDGLVDSLGMDSVYVRGGYFTGAVVGRGGSGTIRNVYVTGSVIFDGYKPEESYIGGIAGIFGGTIENCYFIGNVGDTDNLGGLVGKNTGIVRNTYVVNERILSVSFSEDMNIGGAIGVNGETGSVENTYALNYYMTQRLIGADSGTVDSNSKLDTIEFYIENNHMREQSLFKGFDFENVWDIAEGKGMPVLRAFFKKISVTPLSYGVNYCTNEPLSQWTVLGDFADDRYYTGLFKVVLIGNRVEVDMSDIHNSDQRGYTFVSKGVEMAYAPAEVKVTGLSVKDKTFDGTTDATLEGLDSVKISGICKNDEVTLDTKSVVATFENETAGKNKKIKLEGLKLVGADSVLANYELVIPNLTASIIALSSSSAEPESSSSAKSKKSSSSSAKSSSSKKSNAIPAKPIAEITDNSAIIRFNGHSVQVEKNGMRFDLLGNKTK
ncbi:MAG: hypothetical protein II892_02715 [Fibrobacter sp.]|nr:hypothetical protein [Fibrobacter sp.]